MNQKSTIIAFVISFIVVGSLVALFTWKRAEPKGYIPIPASQPVENEEHPRVLPQPVVDVDNPSKQDDGKVNAPRFESARIQKSSSNLIHALMRVLEGGEAMTTEDFVAHSIMSEEAAAEFNKALSKGHVPLNPGTPVTEIGSDNGKVRYLLNFRNGAKGIVDLVQGKDGKWVVSDVNLPSAEELQDGKGGGIALSDPLGVAYDFVRASLKADYRMVRKLSDPEKVSDATIAGLCILFEDGNYHLRQKMPIRGMFSNTSNAGFLVYLANPQGDASGNMGLTMQKNSSGKWMVTEVALDSLLDDYAKRFSDGDSVYFPLVKNPKGGDSIALFFGFNEDTLTPRSVRQLEIVAEVIMMEGNKKLEISGHTDDVGSDAYNNSLSERRALAVKKILVERGVSPDKISTKGFGKSHPRRTYSPGTDIRTIDEVRSENRRAEMYLDF